VWFFFLIGAANTNGNPSTMAVMMAKEFDVILYKEDE